MKLFQTKYLSIFTFLIFINACQKNEAPTSNVPASFELLTKSATGLDFDNTPVQSQDLNVFQYMYFFNGGGVAAGDFNKDGQIDLFFTSNMGKNKMFLNQGGLKFKDITEQANVNPEISSGIPWKTGASVVDINNDGMLDIYVSQVGDYRAIKGRNRLLVCQSIDNGIPVFSDESIAYGLDLVGFGTQATFFDYDCDGDLDFFQLNHSLHQNGTFGPRKEFEGTQHPLSGDKLFRNDNGKYTEVTLKAGLKSTVIGYGLGVVTGDINLDGWPDIYIGNDFHENDYLYINQKDGTFKESLTEVMMHTSRFSMGVDMADINNDGWNDIISLDMEPEDPEILKASLGEDGFSIYQFKLGYGYHNQYARNALQINDGTGMFREVAKFSGVSATDWSWAPLFMDFDNDGNKDLFISNGIPRRMNDIDFVNFQDSAQVQYRESVPGGITEKDLGVVEKMPRIKLKNKFLKNPGTSKASPAPKYVDLANEVKNNLPTYSNGAVYADLDNDGDLDVVVNNIEDEPFIYKNLENEHRSPQQNYLSLNLNGSPENIHAIGARVVAFKGNERIIVENYAVRGYQSSSLGPLHVGIGEAAKVDSVLLIWPDRTFQKLDDIKYNQSISVQWKKGLPLFDFSKLKPVAKYPIDFQDVTAQVGLNFKHKETMFVEFNRESLMPHMVSSEGPALAVGDINGDGLEDVFFGSSKFSQSKVYLQNKLGKFTLNTPAAIAKDSIFEDVDAVLVDIDNDKDLDLVVAAGGNEFKGQDEPLKQRYYLNDGKGNFERKDFPDIFMTASCVLPADFNKDGLMDFFFGARAIPWNYGLTPTSALLLNKGNGQFENITAKAAEGLEKVGLVKNGTWSDMDGDGDLDLVLALEWQPIQIFNNEGGQFKKTALDPSLSGWWTFTQAADFDQDGDMDILAGNFGQNSKLKPTKEQPVRLYVSDFDNNGQIEQLMTYYLGNKETPFATHAEMMKQLPKLKKQYLEARKFAKASAADLVGKKQLEEAIKLEINTLSSYYFENTGKGQFKPHVLPDELQFSSLNASSTYTSADKSQSKVLVGGNFYDCNIEMGRYDANYGNLLNIGAEGKMEVSRLGNVSIKGQVRRIRPINIKGQLCYVFARNNDNAIIIK